MDDNKIENIVCFIRTVEFDLFFIRFDFFKEKIFSIPEEKKVSNQKCPLLRYMEVAVESNLKMNIQRNEQSKSF